MKKLGPFQTHPDLKGDPKGSHAPKSDPKAEAPPPGGKDGGASGGGAKDRRNAKRARSGGEPILGVYVTPTTVHGVLLREAGDRYAVLRRFMRQRNAQAIETPDLAAATPQSVGGDTGDVTIQFGAGADDLAGTDLFLDSEFGDLAGLDLPEQEFQPGAVPKRQATPVVFELKDLIEECTSAGHERPAVTFCLGTPDVEYVEIVAPDEKKGEKKDPKAEKKGREAAKDSGPVKTERLLASLETELDEPFDKERVAFLPMTPREGRRRYLAVVPAPEEPLEESLELLREQDGMRRVVLRAIDAEVPVLVGLVRWAFPAEPHENTAIVRVGSEDTLVILLQGSELHHQEHMRSVTTFDGPDTICSRVLLQQDVQGVGTVHQVIVLSEERENDLVQGFSAFYPDARVEALRVGLKERGVVPPGGEAALSARSLPALGVALRTLLERQKDTPFEAVNMLPKRLRRQKAQVDLFLAWHTLVVGVLLFFTVLFFVSLYFGQLRTIDEARQRVAAFPEQLSMSPEALQAQIDSLRSVSARITATLNTIDSLLVGSDTWSRTLAKTTRATASTGGVWIEQWEPQGAGVRFTGYATGRDRVVQFAERMNGSIESLAFDEIREYPVYAYVLEAPVPYELPEVARYLREQVDLAPQLGRPDPEPLAEPLAGEDLGTEYAPE